MEYQSAVNGLAIYLVAGAVLLAIVAFCVWFMVRSWKAGLAIGMDRSALRRAVASSATFTVLPSVSILLGVVALSGTLGVPLPWLRLSVIGALQYELNVAEIAATSIGLSGLKASEMSAGAFTTIALVMTAGILGGAVCSIFGLRRYLAKVAAKAPREPGARPGFGAWATIAMFIGLCSAYIGSYVGTGLALGDWTPASVAGVSALAMLAFEYFTVKKKLTVLENFDLATSMLVGMTFAVLSGRL